MIVNKWLSKKIPSIIENFINEISFFIFYYINQFAAIKLSFWATVKRWLYFYSAQYTLVVWNSLSETHKSEPSLILIRILHKFGK